MLVNKLVAAAQEGQIQQLKDMLEMGADVSVADNNGKPL